MMDGLSFKILFFKMEEVITYDKFEIYVLSLSHMTNYFSANYTVRFKALPEMA